MIQYIFDHTVFIRSFLLILTLLLLSSYYTKKFLNIILPYALFRFILIPGVIIHELSHAVGCLITGAKVESISIFGKEGGEVKHGPPFIKFLGPTIISMAPIAGGLLMYILWTKIMNTPFRATSQNSGIIGAADSFISQLSGVKWLSWEIWLFLYGILNLVIVISPSAQDFSNCKWELVVILLAFSLLEFFKVYSGNNLSGFVYRSFVPFLLFASFFMIIATPFYLIKKKSGA